MNRVYSRECVAYAWGARRSSPAFWGNRFRSRQIRGAVYREIYRRGTGSNGVSYSWSDLVATKENYVHACAIVITKERRKRRVGESNGSSWFLGTFWFIGQSRCDRHRAAGGSLFQEKYIATPLFSWKRDTVSTYRMPSYGSVFIVRPTRKQISEWSLMTLCERVRPISPSNSDFMIRTNDRFLTQCRVPVAVICLLNTKKHAAAMRAK